MVRYLAAAFLVALAAAAPAAQRTITKAEIRADPPARTHQRMRDVVWDMIERQDLRRDEEPVNPLTDLWLRTKLRGTEVPGLCRYDSIRVELAPLDRRKAGPETRVRAVGLTSRSLFAFVSPPEDDYYELSDWTRLPSDTDCDVLEGKDERFFEAEEARLAHDGFRAWLSFRKLLADKAPVPLRCELHPTDEESCEDLILSMDADDLHSVAACQAEAVDQVCYLIDVQDREIRLLAAGHVSPGPPEGQILGAELTSLIVMSHQRID